MTARTTALAAVIAIVGSAYLSAPRMDEVVGDDSGAHERTASGSTVEREHVRASLSAAPAHWQAEPRPSNAVESTLPTAAAAPEAPPAQFIDLRGDTFRVLTYTEWSAVKAFPASEQMRALSVTRCETNGSADPARAVGRAGEVGMFQIHPIHFERFAGLDLTDPEQNGIAAYELWRIAGWQPWGCKPI